MTIVSKGFSGSVDFADWAAMTSHMGAQYGVAGKDSYAVAVGTGDRVVTVLPITHSVPADPELAVEIPAAVKRRLRLDDDRSWVVLTENDQGPGYTAIDIGASLPTEDDATAALHE